MCVLGNPRQQERFRALVNPFCLRHLLRRKKKHFTAPFPGCSCNTVRKTGVQTLREESSGAGKPTEPTLDTVTYTDDILNKPAEKMKLNLEQQGYNIAYKEKLCLYNEGEKEHEENDTKA